MRTDNQLDCSVALQNLCQHPVIDNTTKTVDEL